MFSIHGISFNLKRIFNPSTFIIMLKGKLIFQLNREKKTGNATILVTRDCLYKVMEITVLSQCISTYEAVPSYFVGYHFLSFFCGN